MTREQLLEAFASRMESAQTLANELGTHLDGREIDVLTGIMATITLAFSFACHATSDNDAATAHYVKQVTELMATALVEGGKLTPPQGSGSN